MKWFAARTVGLVLLGLAAAPAWAMINPDFTPVHLVKDACRIAELEVAAPGADGKMAVKVLRTLKGEKLDALELVAAEEAVRKRLAGEAGDENSVFDSAFAGQPSVRGVVFFGKNASSPGAGAEVAHVRIGKAWFGLKKGASGAWVVGPAGLDLKAVWDGDPVMLSRLVEELVADPRAVVPSRSTGQWAKWEKIGTAEGGATTLRAADLLGDGRLTLLVGSTDGDRAYRREGETFKDVTTTLKPAGKSRALATGDFNGDGRQDLAGWDGKQLVMFTQSADGTFETWAAAAELTECLGLEAVGLRNARAGVVVSTKAAPLLATLAEDGKLALKPVAPEAAYKSVAGALGPAQGCVAADFNGDGWADLVQVFAKGGLFYPGRADGTFAAPVASGAVYGFSESSAGTPCDLDADGVLDVLLVGSEGGVLVWRGKGDGQFELIAQTQEAGYSVKAGGVAVAVCDWNNDGRQDFISFHAASSAMPFYGRGFAAFGFEQEMDFAKIDALSDVSAGQVGGLAADMNADGWADAVLALKDGSVWVVYQKAPGGPGLAVAAGLPAKESGSGPVKVVGYEGRRCLGAWNVTPGGLPAWFARLTPGPVKLTWRVGGSPAQQGQAVVEEGPVRVWLGAKGLLHKAP